MKQIMTFGLVALMSSMVHAASATSNKEFSKVRGLIELSETVEQKAATDICIQAAVAAVAKQADSENMDLTLTDVKSFKLIGVVSFQSSLSPEKTIVVAVEKTSAKKCVAGEVSIVENQDDVGIGGITVHN